MSNHDPTPSSAEKEHDPLHHIRWDDHVGWVLLHPNDPRLKTPDTSAEDFERWAQAHHIGHR